MFVPDYVLQSSLILATWQKQRGMVGPANHKEWSLQQEMER
jgi:hypothetical protein